MLANYNVTAAPLAPQVVLLSRVGASPTTANTLRFVVAFSQDVTGVSAADFQLACTDTTGTISSVVGYGSGDGQAVYVVTVSNVFGNGTLGLNLADNGSIVDAAYPTLALSSTGFQPVSGGYPIFTGQVYTVASPFVWDGQGSDNNWTTGANWVGGQTPLPGSSLLFTGSAQTATDNDFPDGTSFAAIEIAGNSFALSGDDLSLTQGITVDSGVTGAAVAANIALDGPVTFNVEAASPLPPGDGQGEAASPLPPGEGQGEGGSLTDTGVLSGAGSLTDVGPGSLALTGANDYSGGTTLSGGTLSFAHGSLGTGGITFAGGTLQWASGNTQDVSSQFIALASGQTAILDTNGNDVTLASAISGDGSLTKAGSGTLTLTGADTVSGPTTVSGGAP